MRFNVLTLFPEMIEAGIKTSILGRAMEKGLIEVRCVNIRDYAFNKHNSVDDYTYGGGAGMLMQAEPIYRAFLSLGILAGNCDGTDQDGSDAGSGEVAGSDIVGSGINNGSDTVDGYGTGSGSSDAGSGDGSVAGSGDGSVAGSGDRAGSDEQRPRVIYASARGVPFTQKKAEELAMCDELTFICGHYEGVDQRVVDEIVTDEISIGDYVLTGGELPVMVMIDTVSRLLPGVLGNEESAGIESYSDGLLEYPQYSRPEIWRDRSVPEILLSGNHAAVDEWRLHEAIRTTRERRPDLYEKYKEAAILRELELKPKRRKLTAFFKELEGGGRPEDT